MSRAFVKEQDGDGGEDLPELAVSPHRNLVTPDGLAHMDEQLRRLDAALTVARAAGERATMARIERDRRYWSRRRATAEVVPPPGGPHEPVRFGSRVTIESGAGQRVQFRIVGEDEADPAAGRISWVSPMAESLLGAVTGDTLPFQSGEAEIVAIE
ncbi:MAG: GreA/GreB family elongation factor [Steroidobacteraceae bacterium]